MQKALPLAAPAAASEGPLAGLFHPAVADWFARIGERPAVIAGTDVKNAANLSSARPVLTDEQWSNLFGKNMLEAPRG